MSSSHVPDCEGDRDFFLCVLVVVFSITRRHGDDVQERLVAVEFFPSLDDLGVEAVPDVFFVGLDVWD